MKFSFSQASMIKGLQNVMGAISPRVPMASLSNLHLKLSGTVLDMTATDLEVTVSASVDLIEAEGEGSILVQAKRFQELVRELPDVPLEIEIGENDRVLLKGEGVGEYILPGGDPLDFPDIPNVEAQLNFKMEAEDLRRIINKTIFAVSHDEMRPVLTGLLLQVQPGELRIVATDGHRLSRVIKKGIDYSGEPKDVIVPMKALNLLVRNLADDEPSVVNLAETKAAFKSEKQCLITRLIDGNYPRYESVIPESNSGRLVTRTSDFMSKVRRVSIFASQITRQLRLFLDGSTMRLESEDQEQGGQAVETLAVEYTGEPLEIAYNATYLMDVLKQVDTEDVIFEMAGQDDAALIRGTVQHEDEDFLMLLMPIRLR